MPTCMRGPSHPPLVSLLRVPSAASIRRPPIIFFALNQSLSHLPPPTRLAQILLVGSVSLALRGGAGRGVIRQLDGLGAP